MRGVRGRLTLAVSRTSAWAAVGVTLLMGISSAVILWPGPFDLLVNPWILSVYVSAATGALIITRHPTHPIGWLFTLLGLSVTSGLVLFSLASEWSRAGAVSAAGWADAFANALSSAGILALPAALLRFPNGDLPSRRWRWAWRGVGVAAALGFTAALLNGGWGGDVRQALVASPLRAATKPWGDVVSQAFYPMMFVAMATSGAAVIMRFRLSRGEKRQQMKWLALAGAYLVIALIVAQVTAGSVELDEQWLIAVVASAFASIPLAVAVAILRYRLYDIDIIINRTLVYGLLSVLLVVVYVAGVFLLQQLLSPITAESDLAIAASTLAVAALFRPARTRIQGFIDRRFYRRKYDAVRTLEAFSSQLRNEIDLETLGSALLGVVQETMQPAGMSLWLREPATPAEQNTPGHLLPQQKPT